MFQMVEQGYNFLKEDPENCLVVHCNSGKGRTGTAISALLRYLGYFDKIEDCIKFFNYQRFSNGKGATQPE